ncbi:MAG: flagellar motor switch phosphatase FliY [Oscillospiraceae bacterium]|nr:flagellar motor switch phosphatase FliY [Oscillospiraceae bacterium]
MGAFPELFSPMEIDAIGEILNISLGSSATAVSNMVEKRVNITTPMVEVVALEEFEYKNLEPAVGVEITYTEGLEGSNIMLLKREDIKVIVELLMNTEIPDEDFELNEINISAVSEVMNQMMGASATALAEFLGEAVNISTPVSFEVNDENEFKSKYFTPDEPMIVVRFNLSIEDRMESEFMNIMTPKLAKRIISGFGLEDHVEEEAPEPAVSAPPPAAAPPPVAAAPVPAPVAEAPAPAPAPAAVPPPPPPAAEAPAQAPAVYYQPQSFDARMIPSVAPMTGVPERIAVSGLGDAQASNLELLMSVPLQLSVEIGRTKRPLKEILEFSTESLVVLDKLAGDTVDLFVNGQCVARGDVVVVDDYFGVRITEIVRSPEFLLK